VGLVLNNLRFIRSLETDPCFNLALEEWIFRESPGDQPVFLTYRNSPSIICGRNQNPWLEANVQGAVDEGVPVLRRVSGGGTVCHDVGNLNYSFILPRNQYHPGACLDIVCGCLQELRVPAVQCQRHSLWLHGAKISGTAYMLTGKRAMLHGCLLVESDLARIERLLAPPDWDISGNCVKSTRSRVTRLIDHLPGLSVVAVEKALIATCEARFGVNRSEVCDRASVTGKVGFSIYDSKYQSWEWGFGRTGKFRHCFHLRLRPTHGAENELGTEMSATLSADDTVDEALVELHIRRGCIEDVRISVPGQWQSVLDTSWWQAVRDRLPGLPYDGEAIGDCLGQLAKGGAAPSQVLAQALVAAVLREISHGTGVHVPC